jgi:O-acetyl-ADP-ribose deacetylase (regulator of RNase III)
MITFKTGNIFDSEKDYIVIPVNCGGVAGAGLAEQFRIKYPEAAASYFNMCKEKILKIGTIGTIDTYDTNNLTVSNGHISCNAKKFMLFPTKDFWYNDSKIETVEASLNEASEVIKAIPIKSIAFPAVGCGFGLLKWDIVKPLMVEKLKDLDCDIEIYEAQPERELADKKYLRKTSRSSG